ncbi:MAG: c-type cytochrome [Deltaproteobacteria bacterium]|nr:c-type cytochrome [Deltaproteobacteria bacterium]
MVDYELQSILIDNGFNGDADVFNVSACEDLETCLSLSEERNSDPQAQKLHASRPRAKSTVKANFETIQEQLELGRKLVKAARCRGCHNLEGFGPDHAPSLTWKRFKYEEHWLEHYIQSPYRMRPAIGDLMMLKYTSPNAKPSLKTEELSIVAKYLTNVATASAPSDRYLRELWQGYDCYECHTRLYKTEPIEFTPTPIPQEIRESFQANQSLQQCINCHPFGDLHSIKPQDPPGPNAFATDLVFVFEKLSINYLGAFLQNPSYLEPQSQMPNLGLSEKQINDILDFARGFKGAIENGNLSPNRTYYEMKKDGIN